MRSIQTRAEATILAKRILRMLAFVERQIDAAVARLEAKQRG